MSQYSLTLNNSDLASPTFAVFAQLEAYMTFDVFQVAWLTKQVNAGNSVTFTWETLWGFSFAAQATGLNYTWQGNRIIAADPNSAESCGARFSCNGDWSLSYESHTPDGGKPWIDSDGTVPNPKEAPSSLAVTLNGNAVSAVATGPNLKQTFLTHPT